MKLALTGDVMLGRLVDQYVIQNPAMRPESIWGDVLPLMLAADARLINLECVISSRGREWEPQTKAFHFRAHPRAIAVLQAARVGCVNLANNHVLDYGPEALLDCLNLLDHAGIKRTGAGLTMTAAMEPAVLDFAGGPVAVIGLTDNELEWEATGRKPGVNYVHYNERGMAEPYRSRMAQVLAKVRRRVGLVIVSAHVGPNWGTPSRAMRALAHELIDLGADLYWGHSNHTPQGIETYKGKVILYSTGDFVDDYAVDEHERNDLSFLFVLEIERGRIVQIRLHPVRIDNFRVRLADEEEATFLRKTMQTKCAGFRTPVTFLERIGTITVS